MRKLKPAKKRKCQKCGKALSIYNKGRECFCHKVNEENEQVFDGGDIAKNKEPYFEERH